MQGIDRWLGVALAVLGTAVFWTSRSFPAVPGQKVGAGFLPGIVGVGLLLCAVALLLRSGSAAAYAAPYAAPEAREPERYGPAAVVVLAALGYILLADVLGFLVVAPLALLAVFLALHVKPLPALAWAVGGSLVVHVAFYKLLRVPLPWGLLKPLY